MIRQRSVIRRDAELLIGIRTLPSIAATSIHEHTARRTIQCTLFIRKGIAYSHIFHVRNETDIAMCMASIAKEVAQRMEQGDCACRFNPETCIVNGAFFKTGEGQEPEPAASIGEHHMSFLRRSLGTRFQQRTLIE